jgi:hypothetical protein
LKKLTKLTPDLLIKMLISGSNNLSNHMELINNLNFFPVADNDTGTNMKITMLGGIKKIENIEPESFKLLNKLFCQGIMYQSRGNSGNILCAIFKGVFETLSVKTEIDIDTWTKA